MVAGAVMHADGRVLIAQRPPGKPLAGEWEFPGGKLEAGETRAAGLARELYEEVGIAIGEPRPLLRHRHAYSQGGVLIDMWVVTRFRGEPRGLDGQAIKWCWLDDLPDAQLLPADRPIVRALRLPECLTSKSSPFYSIGAASMAGNDKLKGAFCGDFSDASDAVRDSRVDFLALSNTLRDHDLARLCEAVDVPVYARGVSLEAAWALGATGITQLHP